MNLRRQNIDQLKQHNFDVLIVGGGINGAVSAAALAARGVKVALIDARDFAGFTSQHSSNLVWGGIKYMEGYEFGLVNELCKSRNKLLESFPSTVKEIRFLMTIHRQFRFHPWVILASTWLYWLFGRGQTRLPRRLSAQQLKQVEPLIDTDISRGGVEYSDAYLHDNDARFVFNFVRGAMDSGCVAANYLSLEQAERDSNGNWQTNLKDEISGSRINLQTRILINAAGAYVDPINKTCGIETEYRHLLSKGIHLIVPRLSEQHRVLAFFANDERLFFAIPMANRTCLGTTDTQVEDPLTEVTDIDRDFVLQNINARLDLSQPLTREDIIAERCGVRPLAVRKQQGGTDDFHQLSRRHVIETRSADRHISIFGGKLTDCLNVGDEICDCVASLGVRLGPRRKWYGEPAPVEREAYLERAKHLGIDQIEADDTGEVLGKRLWRRYGIRAMAMLDAIERDPGMSEPIIEKTGIRRCEIDHLAENEMIVKLEDYLRRRSKIELLVPRATLRESAGLYEVCIKLFGDDAKQKFNEYFNE